MTSPFRRAEHLAARHHGVVTFDDALRAGLTDRQIIGLVRTGRWIRLARGVFAVAGAPATWQRDTLAAWRAGPPGTAASHTSGTALFRLTDPPPRPHITVPRGTSGRVPIAIVHRSTLHAVDVTAVGPIACTMPARTLVDSAAVLRRDVFENALDTALIRELTTVDAVRESLERAAPNGRRPGRTALLAALEVWVPGPLPGSPAEMRLLRRLCAWGLPRPVRQHEVRDPSGRFVARVDLAWPRSLVGLEYDGRETHGPRRAQADARRQAALEALGWRIERVHAPDLRPRQMRLRDLLVPLLLAHAA